MKTRIPPKNFQINLRNTQFSASFTAENYYRQLQQRVEIVSLFAWNNDSVTAAANTHYIAIAMCPILMSAN